MDSSARGGPGPGTDNGAADPIETEIAELLVDALRLDVAPDAIDRDAPLFGSGLGLDSIDALELALTISRRYGIVINSDDPRNREIFASLRSLAAHVAEQRLSTRRA
jgi:acyl carrier protein